MGACASALTGGFAAVSSSRVKAQSAPAATPVARGTYLIKNGAKADPTEQPGAADVFAGPGGVLYVTGNSASGSKYYDITAPDASGTSGAGNGADPLNPSSYWYNSSQNQEHVRSYVKVQVRADKLVVENVRSGNCAAPNAAAELGNVPCDATTQTQPVGSVTDSVTGPSSSLASTRAMAAARSTMFVCSNFLKLVVTISTRYEPGRRFGVSKRPSASVSAVRGTPVLSSVIRTVALATTAP